MDSIKILCLQPETIQEHVNHRRIRYAWAERAPDLNRVALSIFPLFALLPTVSSYEPAHAHTHSEYSATR